MVNCIKNKTQKQKVFSFNNKNVSELSNAIISCKLVNVIGNNSEIDVIWNLWKTKVLTLIETYIPRKTVKSNNKVPWLNNALKRMYRKQKRLH